MTTSTVTAWDLERVATCDKCGSVGVPVGDQPLDGTPHRFCEHSPIGTYRNGSDGLLRALARPATETSQPEAIALVEAELERRGGGFAARSGEPACACSPRGPYPLREGHSCACWPLSAKGARP